MNITTDTSALAGKDRIRVLFVRPPYHVWPILNESDQFLLPLAQLVPRLAAVKAVERGRIAGFMRCHGAAA